MVVFGQVVLGTPGSGKTTYCRAMEALLTTLKRKPIVINLDPANEFVPYKCAGNVADLMRLVERKRAETHAKAPELGPNGAVIYCAETLERNVVWLEQIIRAHMDSYVIFDCPGQVELYTHHESLSKIFERLQDKFDMRLCAVHLVDSVCCTDPAIFMSAMLVSLSGMLHLSLPHVNVLSKVDLLKGYGPLPFDLEFYMDGFGLRYLADAVSASGKFGKRYAQLTESIAQVVEEFSLVSFSILTLSDSEKGLASARDLLRTIDKANGYGFANIEDDGVTIFDVAAGLIPEEEEMRIREVIEHFQAPPPPINDDDDDDNEEEEEEEEDNASRKRLKHSTA